MSRTLLPAEIIDRKKQGFPIPLFHWLRTEARSLLYDHLTPEVVRRRGLFDPTYVQKMLDEFAAGITAHGQLLWGLLSVELWYRQFIDSPSVTMQAKTSEASMRRAVPS